MEKIKNNLETFFTIWGIILVLNQVFIFGGCFAPYCLLAALPHTGIIAFFVSVFFIKENTSNVRTKKRSNNINSYFETNSKYSISPKTEEVKPLDINEDIEQSKAVIEPKINKKTMPFEDQKRKELDSLIIELESLESKQVLDLFDLVDLLRELKSLESKLQTLIERKTEYLNNIEEFNREYNLHLGELIRTILNLKKEILYNKTIKQQKQKEKYNEDKQTFAETKETIDELKSTIDELEEALESIDESHESYDEIKRAHEELQEELRKLEEELELQEEELEKAKEFIEDDEIQEEFEEAKSHYDEFENGYKKIKEDQKDIIELNADEKSELKKLYKKAARLCHPDIVADELKEKAHEMMQKLNEAYSRQDLVQLKKILHSLESGVVFDLTSDSINDKELLKAKIKEYEENVKNINDEIAEIQEDDIYKTISNIEDWDDYFEELKSELEKEKYRLEEEAKEILKENIEFTQEIKVAKIKQSTKTIQKEYKTPYAEHILSIENPNFEKIRRYCNNLINENQAGKMQEHLAKNGKMYKALMYDALEQFLAQLNGETITLVDWGCDQGIASVLVVDYIREKQLDIKVTKAILIDSSQAKLSRAMTQIEAVSQDEINIIALKSDDNKLFDTIKTNKNNIALNLFANDKMPVDFLDIDYDIFEKDYFMCLSNESEEFVDQLYEDFTLFVDCHDLSIRDGKIGRFTKFERIFFTKKKN